MDSDSQLLTDTGTLDEFVAEEDKRQLVIPKESLALGLTYRFIVEGWMEGFPENRATSTVGVEVIRSELIAMYVLP